MSKNFKSNHKSCGCRKSSCNRRSNCGGGCGGRGGCGGCLTRPKFVLCNTCSPAVDCCCCPKPALEKRLCLKSGRISIVKPCRRFDYDYGFDLVNRGCGGCCGGC